MQSHMKLNSTHLFALKKGNLQVFTDSEWFKDKEVSGLLIFLNDTDTETKFKKVKNLTNVIFLT